jgi:bifunctional N-acetylglucosamine-1-phosphate-uridyltransferase/glucosamine-1-phosphate-acetyltransferase GlmU-like protein
VLSAFIHDLGRLPPELRAGDLPWCLTEGIDDRLTAIAGIDRSASVAATAVIDGPVRVGARCGIGPGAVLRGGVWLDDDVRIGPSCEIKASLIFRSTTVAHLSYVGNSVLGSDVNLEAGSVLANHWNERAGAEIHVIYEGRTIATGVRKFGALIGDGARIGANAVTSPGTLLPPGAVVPRLGLIEQT